MGHATAGDRSPVEQTPYRAMGSGTALPCFSCGKEGTATHRLTHHAIAVLHLRKAMQTDIPELPKTHSIRVPLRVTRFICSSPSCKREALEEMVASLKAMLGRTPNPTRHRVFVEDPTAQLELF